MRRSRSQAALVCELEADLQRRQAMEVRCPRTVSLRDELCSVLYGGYRDVSAQQRLEMVYLGLSIAADAGQELTQEIETNLRSEIAGLL